MQKEFDRERFDLVDADRVHLPDHSYGHNRHGALDVWTTTGETGTAFVRQITIDGLTGPLRQETYGTACFFLKEKATSRYFFLEEGARGFYLHDEHFFGASTYFGAGATTVAAWLAGRKTSELTGISADAERPKK